MSKSHACCTAMPLAMRLWEEQNLPTRNFSFLCSQGEGKEIKFLLPPPFSNCPVQEPVWLNKNNRILLFQQMTRNKVGLICSYLCISLCPTIMLVQVFVELLTKAVAEVAQPEEML